MELRAKYTRRMWIQQKGLSYCYIFCFWFREKVVKYFLKKDIVLSCYSFCSVLVSANFKKQCYQFHPYQHQTDALRGVRFSLRGIRHLLFRAPGLGRGCLNPQVMCRVVKCQDPIVTKTVSLQAGCILLAQEGRTQYRKNTLNIKDLC